MNNKRLQEIKDSIDFQREILIAHNMNTLCVDEEQELYDYIINLQSKIDKANKLLEQILVVNDWEHKGKFRPVKNTTAQDVYKTICMLYGILETPYRSDYGTLKEDK